MDQINGGCTREREGAGEKEQGEAKGAAKGKKGWDRWKAGGGMQDRERGERGGESEVEEKHERHILCKGQLVF